VVCDHDMDFRRSHDTRCMSDMYRAVTDATVTGHVYRNKKDKKNVHIYISYILDSNMNGIE